MSTVMTQAQVRALRLAVEASIDHRIAKSKNIDSSDARKYADDAWVNFEKSVSPKSLYPML